MGPVTGVEDLVALAEVEASLWDAGEGVPRNVVQMFAGSGLFGLDLPEEYGGRGADPTRLGSVAASLGEVCTGLRSLLTVSGMVNAAIRRWGTPEQREAWLPVLSAGEMVAGLAATEPEAGTDLSAVGTTIERVSASEVRISGHKVWVTFGQFADLLLVLGTGPDGLSAVLVDTDRPGVRVRPVRSSVGMASARLADVWFDRVPVPIGQVVGPPGFGLSHVIGTALDHGRFTVAWGCVGMGTACLEDAAAHVLGRRQGDRLLSELRTVRAALGRATADLEAARVLCERAAYERRDGVPSALLNTVTAKYVAAESASSISRQAMQLLGSAGNGDGSRVGRFFRDAEIMRIIEGSAGVTEIRIGEHLLARTRVGKP